MGIFGDIGRAFAGLGRNLDKERMAYHYGSDWQEKLARQQDFLDKFAARKEQADEEDRLRQEAEMEYKKQEAAERAAEAARKKTTFVLDTVKKGLDGGAAPEQFDPALFDGIPIPKEAIFAAAGKEIGEERAARAEKEQKAALELERIKSEILLHGAQAERLSRPEKGPAPEKPPKPMTRSAALREAREDLRAEGARDVFGNILPLEPGAIGRRANEILAGEGNDSAEVAVSGYDANDALLSALQGLATPKETPKQLITGKPPQGAKEAVAADPGTKTQPGKLPALPPSQGGTRTVDAKEKGGLAPVQKTATNSKGVTIYLRNGVWTDAQGNPVR